MEIAKFLQVAAGGPSQKLTQAVKSVAKEVLGEDLDPKYHELSIVGGGFENLKEAGDSYTYSNWATTGDVDLSDEIVVPKGGDKFLDKFYKQNPIILYQHDWHQPIGNVRSFESNDKGLYFSEVKLTPIPVVRDVIWPLMKDKTLRGTSIGFYSLKGEYQEGIFKHTDWFLLENSIVSIPCNFGAMIDGLKHLNGPVKELVETSKGDTAILIHAYNQGVMSAKKTVSMYVPEEKAAFSPTGESTEMPYDKKGEPFEISAIHEDYEKLMECTHLIKQVLPDGTVKYLHRLGHATKAGGYIYKFDRVGQALCYILRDQNKDPRTPAELKGLLARLSKAYEKLDKEFPTYEGIPLNKVASESLSDVTFEKVLFACGEATIHERKCLFNDISKIEKTLKRAKEGSLELTAEDKQEIKKTFRMFVDFFGSIEGSEDAAKLTALMDSFFAVTEDSDEGDSPTSIFADNAEEGESTDPAMSELKMLLGKDSGN